MKHPFLLQHLLASWAEDTPDAPAVECRGATLGYADLERRSGAIAALLQEAGVGRGDLVGVALAKSLDTIAAWFGVLKAGAAYVPIDASVPLGRLERILARGGIKVLVAEPRRADLFGEPGPPPNVRLISSALFQEASGTPRARPLIDTDPAYVYFTSGSTGEPKGAVISHRASLSYLRIGQAILKTSPSDVIGNHAPLGFDLASFDVHSAILAGARVSLIPETEAMLPGSILRYLADRPPTILYTVPSTLNRLAALPSAKTLVVPTLRALLFAGEPPNVAALRSLQSVFPNACFHHWYGSTEAALVTAAQFPPGGELPDPLPMGEVVPNVSVEIAEDGELLVSATLLFDGYRNLPEETGAAFAVDRPGRWFRTRDRVRADSGGALLYLGRVDRMVKIRGFRVDPGEVEAALLRFPGVSECAVVALPDPVAGARLIAFLVAPEVELDAVIPWSRRELSAHMVPERAVAVDAMPRTATGKIDKRALDERAASLAGGR